MKHRALVPLILVLVFGTLANAGAEDNLTLERARELALAQSKTLQEALASVDAAKLDEKIHSYTLLPSVAASASGSASVPSTSSNGGMSASAGVTIKQTIFDGTYSVLAAIDHLSTSIAQSTARAEYFNVLDIADSAFYDAAKASATVDAAQSDLASAKASEALAEAKLQAGMISPVDFMKQQATVASNEAALVSAQGTLSVAMRTLASLTGITLPVKLAPVDTSSSDALMRRIATLDDGQTAAFIASMDASAAVNNPSLHGVRLSAEQAQKNVDLAYTGYLPSVSASIAGSSDISGALQGSATVSVSMPLDLWNTSATVTAKKISAKQAALALSEAQRTSSVSIEQAVFDIIASAKSVSASQKALKYAERYYENIQEQYRLSTASAADLSDAAQLVSTDRASLISAQYQFLAGISSLRSLAGVESDDLLAKLVP